MKTSFVHWDVSCDHYTLQLIGSSVLAVGIWVKVDAQHLLDLTKDVSGTDLNDTDIPGLLDSAVLILIVAGGFIFLLGFIGCCGALTFKQKVGKLFLKVVSISEERRFLPSSLISDMSKSHLGANCTGIFIEFTLEIILYGRNNND